MDAVRILRGSHYAVGDGNIAEASVGFGAQLDGVAVGADDAVGDHHILAGGRAAAFQGDAIVVGIAGAIAYTHIAAAFEIEEVVVGAAVIPGREAGDAQAFASQVVLQPHGGVAQAQAFDPNIAAPDHLDQAGASIKVMPAAGESGALPINFTLSAEGDIFGIFCVKQGAETIVISTAADGRFGAQGIISDIRRTQEAGTAFEEKPHAGTQDERPDGMAAWGNGNRSSARLMGEVNQFLKVFGSGGWQN